MMKTITGTSLRATILSWLIALAVFAGAALFLWLTPAPRRGSLEAKDKKPKTTARSAAEKMKQEQSQRALPANYAKELVKQSEVMVKKNLEGELRKFREMSQKMRRRKDELLAKVEGRKLPSSAPADANDTSLARAIAKVQGEVTGTSSVAEIYALLREYEAEIQKNHLAVNAAKQALSKGLSFPEVFRSLQQGASRMPDFEALIKMQAKGGDWARTGGSNASAGLSVKSTADLNNYRGVLGQAARQTGLAGTRLENLFGAPRQIGRPGGGGQGNGGQGNPGGNPGGSPGGNGQGNGGMAGAASNNGVMTPMSHYAGPRLNQEMVKAQALPGRRFSKSAERRGWLYVNTWYMIGPWENFGRDDFAMVHPPEVSIDFDAVYTDGQVGAGMEETDSDPIMMIGEEVPLDGTLRWKFMQSESMHNVVPVTAGHATYYAYTELYFDETTTMLVAIGTDDSGRVWINGKDVWQDSGTSWYKIDEHIEPFRFIRGWNRILVRLENGGGGAAGFSFLIIPQE